MTLHKYWPPSRFIGQNSGVIFIHCIFTKKTTSTCTTLNTARNLTVWHILLFYYYYYCHHLFGLSLSKTRFSLHKNSNNSQYRTFVQYLLGNSFYQATSCAHGAHGSVTYTHFFILYNSFLFQIWKFS